MRNAEYNDLEGMVFRMELTYNDTEKIFVMEFIDTTTIGYTVPPGVYQISDINSMLKFLLPNVVKVDITIDDFRLKANLTTYKTMRFRKKSCCFTILGFIQSHSRVLGNIECFV